VAPFDVCLAPESGHPDRCCWWHPSRHFDFKDGASNSRAQELRPLVERRSRSAWTADHLPIRANDDAAYLERELTPQKMITAGTRRQYVGYSRWQGTKATRVGSCSMRMSGSTIELSASDLPRPWATQRTPGTRRDCLLARGQLFDAWNL